MMPWPPEQPEPKQFGWLETVLLVMLFIAALIAAAYLLAGA